MPTTVVTGPGPLAGVRVLDLTQALAGPFCSADPHVWARRMLVDVEQPDGSRPVTLAGQPIKMTKSQTGIRGRPPLLGEHTDQILAEAAIAR